MLWTNLKFLSQKFMQLTFIDRRRRLERLAPNLGHAGNIASDSEVPISNTSTDRDRRVTGAHYSSLGLAPRWANLTFTDRWYIYASLKHSHIVQVQDFKCLFNDLMFSNIILDLKLNSSSTPGVEPFEPWLSSLPLELAFQVIASRYIIVGTLAVSHWYLPKWIVQVE